MSLAKALESRYPAPAWALFHEVANGTGFGWTRHADAIAMGIWPSRGLEIHGLEFKANRADWLRELKDPKKAEDMSKYCDHWWLVTTEDGIAHIDEIPTEWGHLTLKGSRLHTVKAAPKRTAATLDKGFVAAVLRQAYDIANNSKRSQEKLDAMYRKGFEAAKDLNNAEAMRWKRDKEQAEKNIAEFEKASGLRIDNWDSADIGKAVKAYMALEGLKYREHMKQVAHSFTNTATTIENLLKELSQ